MTKKTKKLNFGTDLIFPIGRISKMIRKTVKSERYSVQASITLAAVLEYLIAEVLDVSVE